MKSHEEIKKGLECCGSNGANADVCPYMEHGYCWDCFDVSSAYMNIMQDALSYIQQLESRVPRWIPVEERLPESCEFVLCIVLYGEDAWNHELGFVLNNKWVHPGRSDGTVTHWMPLPEPPEEVQHNV